MRKLIIVAIASINTQLTTLNRTSASVAAGTAGNSGLAPYLRTTQQNIYDTCVNTRSLNNIAPFCQVP